MQCHVMSCIVNTVHAMCFLSTNPQPWNSDATAVTARAEWLADDLAQRAGQKSAVMEI